MAKNILFFISLKIHFIKLLKVSSNIYWQINIIDILHNWFERQINFTIIICKILRYFLIPIMIVCNTNFEKSRQMCASSYFQCQVFIYLQNFHVPLYPWYWGTMGQCMGCLNPCTCVENIAKFRKTNTLLISLWHNLSNQVQKSAVSIWSCNHKSIETFPTHCAPVSPTDCRYFALLR